MNEGGDYELRLAWLAAANVGDLFTLQRLFTDHPELLNARAEHKSLNSCTALHVCTWRNHHELVAFLLEQDADVDQIDQAGSTVLQTDLLCVRHEKMQRVCSTRINTHSPEAVAAFKRILELDRAEHHEIETTTLDLLLSHGIDVNHRNETGDTALVTAVTLELTKNVKKLLVYDANTLVRDGHDRSVLDIACVNGFVDIVELLVDRFPDLVTTAGEMALTVAIRYDCTDVLETLHGRVLSPLPQAKRFALGGSLLQTAIEYGSISSVEFLLNQHAPIGWANKAGENAIQVAMAYSRPDILDMVLKKTDPSSGKPSASRSAVASLRHHCTEMEVCGQLEPQIDFQYEDYKLPLFPTLKPWGLQSMEVLVRHGAHFDFPCRHNRDAIAPFLAECLHCIAPRYMTNVLVDLVNCVSLRPNELRPVLVALVWSHFTHEVLILVLLTLFSTPLTDSSRQALAILEPWMFKFDANIVINKLLVDSLSLG